MKTKEEIKEAMKVLGDEAVAQGMSMVIAFCSIDGEITQTYCGNEIELLGLCEYVKHRVNMDSVRAEK